MKYNSGKFFLYLIIGLTSLLSPVLSMAQNPETAEYMNDQKIESFLQVQEFLFNDNFTSADSFIQSYISNNLNDPSGYILKASYMIGMMTDREENLFDEHYLAVLDSVHLLADNIIATGSVKTQAWMYLFKGHALLYRSLWESRFGSKFSSIKQAYNAKNQYETGLNLKGDLYDLYMGLGGFHYWKSAKAGILRKLGFFKNDKKRGIAELRLATDSSLISKEASLNGLIWVWLDSKKFDSVIIACNKLLKIFPDGKLFRWPLAEAYQGNNNWSLALKNYKIIREKLIKDPGNYFNLIECDHNIYECYQKMNLDNKSQQIALNVESYYVDIPKKIKNIQGTKLGVLIRAAKK